MHRSKLIKDCFVEEGDCMRPISEKRRRMAANYVSLYKVYKEYIEDSREDALSLGAMRYDKPIVQTEGQSTVLMSVERLLKTAESHPAHIVDIVDRARFLFDDYINYQMRHYTAAERDIVKMAIWMNGMNPIANTFESFNQNTMPISRRTFYNYRRKFLEDVANLIGL